MAKSLKAKSRPTVYQEENICNTYHRKGLIYLIYKELLKIGGGEETKDF